MAQRSRVPVRLFIVIRWCIVIAVSVPLLWGVDSSTEQIIRRVQDHYNSAKTLQVGFTEQYSMQDHARPVEWGVLTLQKQGKMRWDYTRPAGKLFVSDGKLAYLYTASDNRVEKIPLKDTEDMRAPLAFLLGHLDLKKAFTDFQSQRVGDGALLTAVAKNNRLPYKSIQMLVRTGGSIAGLTVYGQDGSVLKYTFSHERADLPVSEALFHFTVPPGAEVVNAVEYGVQGN